MPYGRIRGLSQYYVDGLERMEIAINKKNASPLPYRDHLRIPIKLKVGAEYYDAGIRATPNVSEIWVCPDLRDTEGKNISLAHVLTNNGFSKKQKVCLEVEGNVVSLT